MTVAKAVSHSKRNVASLPIVRVLYRDGFNYFMIISREFLEFTLPSQLISSFSVFRVQPSRLEVGPYHVLCAGQIVGRMS